MFRTLHGASLAVLVATMMAMSGAAYAQSRVLVYGSPENCPAGAVCAPTKMRIYDPFAMANDHGSEVGAAAAAADGGGHGGGGGGHGGGGGGGHGGGGGGGHGGGGGGGHDGGGDEHGEE